MHDATLLLHAGLPRPEQGQPFHHGPIFAAPYHLSGDPATSAYTYGRYHNPTWTAYEQALTQLEHGTDSVVFASGIAAVAAIFGVALKADDVLLMPSDAYYASRVLAQNFFTNLGVQVRLAPTANNAQLEHVRGAKLLWLETPSNPGLDVCDIALLVQAAHEAGALVVVDNTTATCLGQKPLVLGADFSLSSDTKATTGHSDLLLGHVTVRNATWAEKLRAWRTQIGAVPGPMEVWLAHRSLATLHMRLERQCTNALALAKFLAQRAEVTDLRYPGLPSDAGHAIAAQQMKYFGPIVSFTLPSRAFAEKFLHHCQLIFEATSFGSIHSSAERRARWGGDQIAEGFIRMSVGCEDANDLIADVQQALNKTAHN